MTTIAHNLQTVRARIAAACRAVGREPQNVTLLAVSKTWPAAAIRAAAAEGQPAFGENYAQEAEAKIAALADLPIEWHFIGPVQSNKTRFLAENFTWVHTVDREKIAARLSEQRPQHLPPLNICLQVNVSGEASKRGVAPAEVLALAQKVLKLPGLRLRGLMAIPAPADDVEEQRDQCRVLAKLQHDLQAQGLILDTLSMGMSHDLEAAITEGATIVRIGTAIFGSRNKTE